MNRRSFLRNFGIGMATMAVAAPLLAKEKEIEDKYIAGSDPVEPQSNQGVGIYKYLADGNQREYVMLTGQKGMEQFNKAMEEYAKHYYNI